MKRTALLAPLLAAGVTACSALPFNGEPDPEERMAVALAALGAGDLVRAQEHLHQIYNTHSNRPVGRSLPWAILRRRLHPSMSSSAVCPT